MAAKLVTGSRGTAVRSSHGKTRVHVPHIDTATVKTRSRTLTVIGKRISHETVKEFFLEQVAILVLKLLIPVVASVALYFGIANFPFEQHSSEPQTTITYCVPSPQGTALTEGK